MLKENATQTRVGIIFRTNCVLWPNSISKSELGNLCKASKALRSKHNNPQKATDITLCQTALLRDEFMNCRNILENVCKK